MAACSRCRFPTAFETRWASDHRRRQYLRRRSREHDHRRGPRGSVRDRAAASGRSSVDAARSGQAGILRVWWPSQYVGGKTQLERNWRAPRCWGSRYDSAHEQSDARQALDGKHAVVTGGARGIGAAMARMLSGPRRARDDHRPRPERAANAIRTLGDPRRLACVQGDVTDAERRAARFEQARPGSGRFSILVNNAGQAGRRPF